MAISRFGTSALHQRDPRSALFDSYTGDRNRTHSSSPARTAGGGGNGVGYGAYPGGQGSGLGTGQNGGMGHVNGGVGGGSGGFRSATPNSRGQYSDAVLSELENQNDREIEGISAKVKMLKDLTISIGDEIRTSSSLAESMNNSFDNTRVRLRGTMNRMLRMAEKTGVGWKVWVLFLLAVWGIFAWVWLF